MRIKIKVKKNGNRNTTQVKIDKNLKNINVKRNKGTIKKISVKSAIPVASINGVDINKLLKRV